MQGRSGLVPSCTSPWATPQASRILVQLLARAPACMPPKRAGGGTQPGNISMHIARLVSLCSAAPPFLPGPQVGQTHAAKKWPASRVQAVWDPEACMALHGFAWLCMALHGFAWLCMALHGFAWLCMALHGLVLNSGSEMQAKHGSACAVLTEVLFFGLPDGQGAPQDQALPSLLSRITQLSLGGDTNGAPAKQRVGRPGT
jgi:hypothetical protein